MKFIVQADVDSAIMLSAPTLMTLNNRRVEFGVDGNRVWNSVTITAQVFDIGKIKWGLEPVEPRSPDHAPVHIHANFDSALYGQIRKDLQNLESSIALMFPLRQIHWESPTLNVIFENPTEENPPNWSPLTDFKPGRSKRQLVQPPDADFQGFALLSTRHGRIAVVLSFWREGSNDFEEGNFINAFYNFYFVLEGMYARGKFKTDSVVAEFRKNAELRQSLDKFLNSGSPMNYIHQVTAMMTSRKLTMDAEGMIKLIVYTRGDLHHFADNPNRVQPSLFGHGQFEGLAFLLRFISRQGLMNKMMTVNNSFPPTM